MYKHSPIRNQRSKGIKNKHVVQVCLLIVVCFWLIFQVKRSYDKKKDFDGNNHKITHPDDEIVKLGRKDLQPKLQEITQQQEDNEEEEEENKHEEDEDKIEESVDDENGQERSNMEIDRDEVNIVDEDNETEESDQKDGQSETENRDEDGSTEHTHEAREEHYKDDDASSAVITTHDPENQIKNKTLDDNSSENVGLVENDETTEENGTIGQEKDSESIDSHKNGPFPNTTTTYTADRFYSNSTMTENLTKNEQMLKSTGEENSYNQSKSEYLETNNEDSSDPTYLQEKDARNNLETLPGIEAEGEDTASA